MRKIGVFVGEGSLPEILIERLQRLAEIFIIKLVPQAYCPPNLPYYDIFQCKDIIKLLEKESTKEVCFCGKVSKIKFLHNNSLLSYLSQILNNSERSNNIKDCSDKVLINNFIRYLQKHQIKIIPQQTYLQDLLAEKGCIGVDKVDEVLWADIDYAYSKAKCAAKLGIAQCVAVKFRSIVAIEDIAGTDELIIRAGRLVGGGFTVSKVAYPNMIYELPMVGPTTLLKLKRAQAAALVLQAHKVCIIDKENFLKEAKGANIAVIGI